MGRLLRALSPAQSVAAVESRHGWWPGASHWEWEVGRLWAAIDPTGFYHGVKSLVHRDQCFNTVYGQKALLNAEYYFAAGPFPGIDRFVPRELSAEGLTTSTPHPDGITVEFPAEPTFGLELTMRYTMRRDGVDLVATVTATQQPLPEFELFIASYITEFFSETWAPMSGGAGWENLPNRSPLNHVRVICRDEHAKRMFLDGRHGDLATEDPDDESCTVEERLFERPILMTRNDQTGLALIQMSDPRLTSSLTTQCHG